MENTPKTRRESKKSAKDKKSDIYSAKHIRQLEALRATRTCSASNTPSKIPSSK